MTATELTEVLHRLCGTGLRPDLTGVDLTGQDLRGFDLSWAILLNADLRGSDLRGAVLRWTDLSRANLSNADLFGADLSCACLEGADLSGANLEEVDLENAKLEGVIWPDGEPTATEEESDALAREIAQKVLANPELLDMELWHGETDCGTTLSCRLGSTAGRREDRNRTNLLARASARPDPETPVLCGRRNGAVRAAGPSQEVIAGGGCFRSNMAALLAFLLFLDVTNFLVPEPGKSHQTPTKNPVTA